MSTARGPSWADFAAPLQHPSFVRQIAFGELASFRRQLAARVCVQLALETATC